MAGLALLVFAVVSVLVMQDTNAFGRALSLTSADRPAPVELSSITKTPSVDHFSAAGQMIQYTVTVVNSGNAPAMQPITVTDSRADASGNHPTCTINEIPAYGAAGSCVIDYQVTAADVAAGSVTDTVTAVYHQGEGASERTVTSAPVTVTRQDGAAIGMTSRASSPSFAQAGQTITYTYDVANDGNQPLTGVSVADTVHGTPLDTHACHWSHLGVAAGNFVHCTASYHVTAADVTRGFITNGAVAAGTVEGTGQQVTRRHHTTIHLARMPAIGLATEASTDSFSQAGQDVTYTYHVANDGDTPLTGVRVADSVRGAVLETSGCDRATLDTGASMSCQATYQTTPADVSAGSVTNAATATATANGTPVSASDSTTVLLSSGPAIGLAAAAQPQAFSAAGQPVTYTYTVANDGDSDLAGVHVSDTVEGTPVPVTCDGNQLDVGSQPLTCQSTYDVTQADLARGTITNDATATGTASVNGQPAQVSHSVSNTITRQDQPSIGVATTASADSFDRGGTEISYVYDVTNTGNTPLAGVRVSDSLGVSVNCGGTTALAPGASARCLATYHATVADVAAGHITSTATARGQTAAGAEVTGTSTLRIPAVHAPGLSILKTASPGAFSRAGDRLAYFYQVTNTGNVPLARVTVTDNRLRGLSCPLAALAPGEHMVCTAAHLITAADLARGSVANVARVTGTAPGGRELARSTMAIVPAARIAAPFSSFLRTVPVTG